MSLIKYPKNNRFFNDILNSDRVICVMFAKKDCEACDGILPLIEDLSEKCKKVCFVYIDVDHGTFKNHPNALDLKIYPTFKIYKNRQLSSKVVGASFKKVCENIDKLSHGRGIIVDVALTEYYNKSRCKNCKNC
jgi:thiol-disulfide isomerase/thioredoxin